MTARDTRGRRELVVTWNAWMDDGGLPRCRPVQRAALGGGRLRDRDEGRGRAALRPDYEPLLRAAFARHPFWVTRYRDGELYAAGDFPNQDPPAPA